MLAENTAIDSKTRWREAQEMLADDPAFAAVEDDRDREELFNEFVAELFKSERDEQKARRVKGLASFRELLKVWSALPRSCFVF